MVVLKGIADKVRKITLKNKGKTIGITIGTIATFCIYLSLILLSPQQQFPIVGGIWQNDVNLFSIKPFDLKIGVENGTAWETDLSFQQLTCNGQPIAYTSKTKTYYLWKDFFCNGIVSWKVKALTSGHHYQYFNYGGQVLHLENDAILQSNSQSNFSVVGEPDPISINVITKTLHSYDGFDYIAKPNGTFEVSKFGELQATYGFGMTGTYQGENIYRLSTSYEWDWIIIENTLETIEVQGKIKNFEIAPFKWKINMIVEKNKALKITNYVENATAYNITNLEFFYLFAVNTNQNPTVSYWNDQNQQKEYSYETNILRNTPTELENLSLNNIDIPNMGFGFQDIINENYYLTYLYFGNLNDNKNFLPDKNGFIVGFSKGNKTLNAWQSHTIDPAIWNSLGDKGAAIFSMAYYDGNIMTGDQSGFLGTYNSTSRKWTSLGDKGGLMRTMVVYDGNLYTGDESGYLGTYNSVSNKWNFLVDVSTRALRSLATLDGNLFTGGGDGNLGTYNSTSRVWFNLGNKTGGKDAIIAYDGNIFTGSDPDGSLATYNSTSRVWSNLGDLGTSIVSMAVYDGNLYIKHDDGNLTTYNSGKWIVVKNVTVSNYLYTLAVYDGNLYTAEHTDGNLGTYNSKSNTWVNIRDVSTGLWSIAVYDGNLYTGAADGTLGTYGPRQTTDLNLDIWQIETHDFNSTLPSFSYAIDGNLTMKFRAKNPNKADLNFNMWYGTTSGAKTNKIIGDINLSTETGHGSCDTNAKTGMVCTYDWNILNIADANYWITMEINDGTDTNTATSEKSFRVNPSGGAFDFDVSLPTGITKFSVKGLANSSNNVPTGQNDSIGIFNVGETGGGSGDVYTKISTALTDITPKCDIDNNPTGATTITTSYTEILSAIVADSNQFLWCWADYGASPIEETSIDFEFSATG